MDRTGEEVYHQQEKNGAEPPRMIHVEKIEEVQQFIERFPVPPNILFARSILHDDRADDREKGKENKKKNRQLNGAKQFKKRE